MNERLFSYNRLLNNSITRRNQLIEALVLGSPFPVDERISGSIVTPVTFKEVLEARNFHDVTHVMQLQYDEFGPINENLFWSIMHHLKHVTGDQTWMKGFPKNREVHDFLIPSQEVFQQWREQQNSYFADFLQKAKFLINHNQGVYSNKELCEIINQLLVFTGNRSKGWTVSPYSKTNLISVAKQKKRILVGPQSIKLSRARLLGLLLHEIAIHVEWAEHSAEIEQTSKGEEEAIGTLVEQLNLSDYHPLRLFRFLAIAFAVGLDGQPRDMREAYQKVLSVRRILRPKEAESTTKYYVAKEIVRVFRSLPTDIPGLVYIRDKDYFEHNSKLWDDLVRKQANLKTYEAIVAPWKEK